MKYICSVKSDNRYHEFHYYINGTTMYVYNDCQDYQYGEFCVYSHKYTTPSLNKVRYEKKGYRYININSWFYRTMFTDISTRYILPSLLLEL